MTEKSLQPHIYLPLPSLQDTAPPTGRDERLRTVIANLDKQHQSVRTNILTAAVAKRDQHVLQQHSTIHDPNAMVTSPDPDLSPGELRAHEDTAADLLVASLQAQHPEGSADPCVLTYGALPSPPAGIRQATPPPETLQSKEALAQIETYNRVAAQTREYHVQALRRTSGVGVAVETTSVAGGR